MTALLLAARNENSTLEVFNLLFKAGANAADTDRNGWNACHWLVQNMK
jgi:ankyrin repeat protein